MKRYSILLFSFFIINTSNAQSFISGMYDVGLTLAYNKSSQKITGCYENATGYDEQTKSPRFTCIFYIEGKVKGNVVDIITYYPEEKFSDTISGKLEIIKDKTISIKLREDHGGCWNVEQFSDETKTIGLSQAINVSEVKYVISNKAYFYAQKNNKTMLKKYVVKNDFVYVEKIEGGWAYCSFYGNKITNGWIKLENLNK